MSDKPIVSVSAEQPDAVINIKVSGDLPDGGVDGQVLTRKGGRNVWADPPTGGGAPSEPGEDGGFYVPHVDADGNLSWTASGEDMPSVDSVNIKGDKGDKGEPGEPGKDAIPYTLPTASSTVKGGVMIGEGLEMDGDVLNVDKPELELIETIVVKEEVAQIERTEMNLRAATIRAEFPACEKTGNVMINYAIGHWSNGVMTYMLSAFSSDSVKYGYNKIYTSNGRYRSGWWSCTKNPGEYASYYENPVAQEKYGTVDGNIITITINYGQGLPVGTKIEISGVRANA